MYQCQQGLDGTLGGHVNTPDRPRDSVGQNAHLPRYGEEFAASHFEDLGRKARICQCVNRYCGDVVRCYGRDLTGTHGVVDRSLCLDGQP